MIYTRKATRYFTVVVFVFQFKPENLSILDFALLGVKGLNKGGIVIIVIDFFVAYRGHNSDCIKGEKVNKTRQICCH